MFAVSAQHARMPRGWRPLLPRLRRWSRVVSPVACAPGVFDAPNREADRLVLIRAGIFKGFEVSEDLKVVERDVEGPLDLFEEIVTALNRPLTRDEDVHGDELEVADRALMPEGDPRWRSD